VDAKNLKKLTKQIYMDETGGGSFKSANEHMLGESPKG